MLPSQLLHQTIFVVYSQGEGVTVNPRCILRIGFREMKRLGEEGLQRLDDRGVECSCHGGHFGKGCGEEGFRRSYC